MADELQNIIIEGTTANWDMRLEGDIAGTYAGTFKFRCYLTPMQKIAANREMRELLGAHATMAPEHESNLAFALTQLKHRIVSAPPFWTSVTSGMSGDIADANVILAVLDAAYAAELKYINHVKEKKLSAVTRAKAAAEAMLNSQGKDDFEDEAQDESKT